MSPIVEERNSVVRSKPSTPAKTATPVKSPDQKKTKTGASPSRMAAVGEEQPAAPQPEAPAKMEIEPWLHWWWDFVVVVGVVVELYQLPLINDMPIPFNSLGHC